MTEKLKEKGKEEMKAGKQKLVDTKSDVLVKRARQAKEYNEKWGEKEKGRSDIPMGLWAKREKHALKS